MACKGLDIRGKTLEGLHALFSVIVKVNLKQRRHGLEFKKLQSCREKVELIPAKIPNV